MKALHLKGFCVSFILAALVVCAVFFVPSAWSQPPTQAGIDQATREVDRNVRQSVEKRLEETTPRKPPKVDEDIPEIPPEGPTFTVSTIELTGTKTFPAEDFRPLIEKYENKEITISDLKILCQEIEREYLRRGVIAACFLPPQDIEEGKVTLSLIEAKMGELEVKKPNFFSAGRMKYFWTIKPGEVLRYDKISRSLQFINKNPDITAKVALRAGKKPETTDVLMEASSNFPVHITGSFDNEGAVSTGKQRKGLGLVHNNFLGLNDTLIGGYTGGKNFCGAYGYHRLPITNFGTSIMYGYSQSRAYPKKDYERFELSSRQETYSAYLYQDLYQKDEYKGEVSAGLEKSNKRVVSGAGGDLNVDRITTLSFSTTLVNRGHGNTTTIRPGISQGLNMLGARRLNEFSSRQANCTPTKFNFSSTFKQGLAKNFQASMKLTGQLASEKLTPQQELYLGGIDSVRGYPSGDYLADSGFASNFELLIPAFMIPDWVRVPYGERPIKDEITGVLFFDYGYGTKRGMIQGEQAFRRMGSIGAGIRVRLLNQALLRLEWGLPLNPLVDRPLTESGGNKPRLHFAIDFQDDIPEEVERFARVYKQEYLNKSAWELLDVEMDNPESPLRLKVGKYLYLARKAEEEGNLPEAKQYYALAANIGSLAHRQAQIYLVENYKNIQRLRKLSAEASKDYENLEYEKAKEKLLKIKEEAVMGPLTLEIM